MSDTMVSLRQKDWRSRGSPIRRAHDEGPGRLKRQKVTSYERKSD